MKSQLISTLTAAVISVSGASAGYPEYTYPKYPSNGSYYGYNIDLGGIDGTEMADELNEHKDEIVKYLNELVDDYQDMYLGETPVTMIDYLETSDIDFNSEKKIGTFREVDKLFDYYKNDLTYNDYLKYISQYEDDICWKYVIYSKETTYIGYIYRGNKYNLGLQAGNMEIDDDGIYSGVYFDWERAYEDRYIKENTAKALKGAGEECKDIDAAYVGMGYDTWKNELIIFVDGKAKYIAGITFITERAMCTYLRDDTPGPVREFLSKEKAKLEETFKNKNGRFALYSYNDLMKVVRASLPWVEEDYLDYLDEI